MQLQGFSACSEARFKGGAQESSRRAAQTQPLLRVTAKPDLATSLSGKAAEKIYTGLQQRGSKDGSSLDQNELAWIHKFCSERIHLWATGMQFVTKDCFLHQDFIKL